MSNAAFRQSDLLDAFCPERVNQWRQPSDRSGSLVLTLKNFSFIDYPEESLNFLRALARAETRYLRVRVDFHDEYLMDISPYLVWGLMQQTMIPVVTAGIIKRRVSAALDATELRQFLHIGTSPGSTFPDRIVPFRLRQRRGGGTSKDEDVAFNPSTVEKVGDELVDAVRSWLRAAGALLTEEGAASLYSLSGEILNNAERHGRLEGDGHWAVAGLMETRRLDSGRRAHVCNFAFVSVGLTIADTILEARDPDIREQVERYCELHAGRFDRIGRSALATVFALQDGISRVSPPKHPRGGVGIMNALEAVIDLDPQGDPPPALTIISGDVGVRFASPYWNPRRQDWLRYQWFNPQQSPLHAPDRSHVFRLSTGFPGTIITARFVLGADAVATPGDERCHDPEH
jgi:hypothetical protein